MCEMAIEQYTESLTLKEMKCMIGKNPTQNMKADAFYWMRGQDKYTLLEKQKT